MGEFKLNKAEQQMLDNLAGIGELLVISRSDQSKLKAAGHPVQAGWMMAEQVFNKTGKSKRYQYRNHLVSLGLAEMEEPKNGQGFAHYRSGSFRLVYSNYYQSDRLKDFLGSRYFKPGHGKRYLNEAQKLISEAWNAILCGGLARTGHDELLTMNNPLVQNSLALLQHPAFCEYAINPDEAAKFYRELRDEFGWPKTAAGDRLMVRHILRELIATSPTKQLKKDIKMMLHVAVSTEAISRENLARQAADFQAMYLEGVSHEEIARRLINEARQDIAEIEARPNVPADIRRMLISDHQAQIQRHRIIEHIHRAISRQHEGGQLAGRNRP